MNRDVVFILKESIESEELKYSLRSIEKNLPHNNVWFVGGQPEDLRPDRRLPHQQTGGTKWERVRSSWFQICSNKDITEEFYLFNDDFFVLKPINGPFINYSTGTLERRIMDLKRNVGNSRYAQELEAARQDLLSAGYDTLSFALHIPFLVNKRKAEETLREFSWPMFRSIYGNRNRVPFQYHEDVKIYNNNDLPALSWGFASTTEESFTNGAVGRYIRGMFPEPSRFEKEQRPQQIRELYSEEGDSLYG